MCDVLACLFLSLLLFAEIYGDEGVVIYVLLRPHPALPGTACHALPCTALPCTVLPRTDPPWPHAGPLTPQACFSETIPE